ncbi:MAG: hypothetical protein NTX55_01905 [Candidatus Parcubacteria bacterium]|nr:hypothetical protein [Candidatus Parcubacteria bacterium]
MTTQTAEKIYREIKALKEETRNLKDLVFLAIRDSEGEYRPSFVKRILKKACSKPEFTFVNKTDFLNQFSS